jgi:hypothetical protein
VGELGTAPIARSARARSRYGIPAILALCALLLAGSAAGRALPAPVPTSPASGAVVDGMPAFAWDPVAGVEEYEFQIAADAGFSSPVFGHGKDDFRTKNTRATLTMTAPDGTYWWRVRAIGRNQAASSWSHPRSFTKKWSARPAPLSPANGAAVVYPSTPLKLSWSPVPGARKYLVSIGTDPDVSSLVTVNGLSKPVETSATVFTPVATLSPGEQYYWRVTPEDAEGNLGTPSCRPHIDVCPSFVWSWPSQTTPRVADLDPIDPEFYDPQFSWDPVPGAARYEVDVNSSRDFAASSKVCCTGTTINTYMAPLNVFKSNTYYWRVRALDMDGHAGVWNCYGDPDPACQNPGSFTKTFDNVPPVTPTSITGLTMRDNVHATPVDLDPSAPGYQTSVPLVTWNPVPGAASYQVDVTPFSTLLGSCIWSLTALQGHYTGTTAVTAWTPLGQGWNLTKPYPDPHPVASEGVPLLKGPHCVRVRARSDRPIADEIYGDYTYLDCSTPAAAPVCVGRANDQGWAFDWRGYLPGSDCTAPCSPGYLGAGDYQVPTVGTLTRSTPYFTWKPLTWPFVTLKNTSNADALTLRPIKAWENMLVSANSSQLVLSGSCIPAETFNYSDLTDLANQLNADSACVSATGPSATGPLASVTGVRFSSVGVFSSYFVIVAKDPNFTNIIDYAYTHVPAYAPRSILGPTTYPDETDGTLYYWAVLPEVGWDGTGGAGDPMLATPAPRATFDKRSLPPTRIYPEEGRVFGDQPLFQWSPVLGARTYRLQVSQDQSFANPIEDVITDSTGYASNTTYPADTVLYWRVRANDENGLGLTWSNADAPAWTFQKTLAAPVAGCSPAGGDDIPTWTWSVVPGAVSYDVSVDLPDGTHKDLTGYRTPAMAPTAMYGTGIFHWRVRANFPHSPFGVTPGPYSVTCSFTRTIHAPTGAHADFNGDHVLLSWDAKPGAKRYRVQISGTPDFGQLAENVLTDNTTYAPLLEYFLPMLDTRRLYWRVAALDEGDNTGDFTDAQLITRTVRMEIAIRGTLKRGKRSPITIVVTNFETHGGIARALVRASGAGLRARRLRTDAFGNARLTFRPRRGTLVLSARKPGYRPASLRIVVR